MKTLIDIECFPNFFMLGVWDYNTKEKKYWEISEHRDDRAELFGFLSDYKGYWISFNGKHYDDVVLTWFVKQYYGSEDLHELPVWQLTSKLKEFSDKVINSEQFYEELKTYKYGWSKKITQVDLFLFWSKGLRLSKKISLKSLAVQLNWNHIQELPYPHNSHLSKEEIEEVKKYNLNNDLGILNKLTDAFSGVIKVPLGNLGTIQLREYVRKKYGFDALCWDPPKIASEVLIQDTCKRVGWNVKEFKEKRFTKEEFCFRDLFENQFEFKTEPFISVYNSWMNSCNHFSKEFTTFTKDHGLKISVGVGGIHSVNENEIWKETEDYKIVDIDISSLYPTVMLNLSCFRFKELENSFRTMRDYRVNEVKPNVKKFKGTEKEIFWKNEDAYAKVILNGLSGYIDMEYSPLYYNKGAMKMRCFGQLVLLTVGEQCIQNNISIIQKNTDGLSVYIHKNKIKLFEAIVSKAEKEFNVEFEYVCYKKMIIRNVNSYLAIETNGKVKEKGEFVRNPDLGNSVDELIIPHALYKYFVEGISPEVYIPSEQDPFLFCRSNKIDKKYQVFWNGNKVQNLNRYYVSKKGAYLYKQKPGGNLENVLKGFGVKLYNISKGEKASQLDIDYKYYIAETRKIIHSLEPNQLQLF